MVLEDFEEHLNSLAYLSWGSLDGAEAAFPAVFFLAKEDRASGFIADVLQLFALVGSEVFVLFILNMNR
jgi:hypothetical protein